MSSEKMGAMGGNKGGVFDDGVFDGVKKVIVGKDFNNVTYINIEYEKDGKYEIREHGTNRGELKEFSVDYPNEYITAVGGSYDNVFGYGSTLIKSLLFKTSYGRTSPILGHTTLLGNPAGKEFMLEGKNGGKLLGFHGRSGQALDAIGPYFFVVDSSLKHFKLQGGNGGSAWDDGAFDGVRKVLVGRNGKFVSYIRFEYAKGQRIVPHAHGKRQEAPQEFLVDYPNEHITSVEGTIDGYLTSLKFKTSKGRTSPAFGNVVGSKFVFEETGFKLVGFCGRSGDAIDAIGAHFAPLPAPAPAPVPKNNVTKIYISSSSGGIEQIKFETVENGETKEGIFHGVKGKNIISTVAISNYPDDYLVYIESWYDSSDVFQGIKFKTDKNTSQFFGYKLSEDDGTPFSLHVRDKKITGFTRPADSNLNSPGTYFVLNHSVLAPPNKVEAQGGNYGETFDDGAFDHVRKVYVGQGDSGVAYVKFDYEKDGKRETREHGKMTLLGTEEFEVDSDDYITSVEVSVDNVFGFKSEIVTALVFKTFKGITSPPFGMVTENIFELKDFEGGKLAGFHGKASDVLYALGGYFTPTTISPTPLTPSTAKKLQAKGGNGGVSWDDGAFDGVKRILVGQGNDGVAFVTFEYNKGSQAIIGDGHGKQTLLGTETFELDYPSEYITSVEGYYDKIFGVEAEVVTSLTFKTNKRTSQPFGLTSGEHFELKEEGYKIVGFHGKASELVHQIGVHVLPIFTSYRITL